MSSASRASSHWTTSWGASLRNRTGAVCRAMARAASWKREASAIKPGVGLVADPEAVLGEQAGGVGVVRRDRRLLDLLTLIQPMAALGQEAGGA